ncbi:DinB family protein [Daejeonella oryzae]|uniref:DinB family protein n=1 Tax=Daejeonella oryzae TaxID=1122943 RepID=UPI000415E3FC|nr:DinB family protein [Daejeonella oryzae]
MEIPAPTILRFSSQYKIIKYYIDGLPPEAIYSRFSEEKFSIHESIAYLCRYQYIFLSRLKKISQEVNPFFEIYSPEDDSEFCFTAAKTSGSLLHEIYRVRDEMIQIISKLSSEQFGRFGTHAILGKMNLTQWIEFFLLHESNQLFKIFKSAGSFWSFGNQYQDKVINLPRYQSQVDELAG